MIGTIVGVACGVAFAAIALLALRWLVEPYKKRRGTITHVGPVRGEEVKDWRVWFFCPECGVKWTTSTLGDEDARLGWPAPVPSLPADDRVCPRCGRLTFKMLVDWYGSMPETKV